jgi:hypothetical protein
VIEIRSDEADVGHIPEIVRVQRPENGAVRKGACCHRQIDFATARTCDVFVET